jgi:hypothetical protein
MLTARRGKTAAWFDVEFGASERYFSKHPRFDPGSGGPVWAFGGCAKGGTNQDLMPDAKTVMHPVQMDFTLS